jgi:hypothetical protein
VPVADDTPADTQHEPTVAVNEGGEGLFIVTLGETVEQFAVGQVTCVYIGDAVDVADDRRESCRRHFLGSLENHPDH